MGVQSVVAAICREPAKRELYLAAMRCVRAGGAVERFDVEDAVDAQPQRSAFYQSAGTLVDALVSCGALVETLPDPVFDEDAQEEYVDMARAVYELSEDGAGALAALDPAVRIAELFDEQAGRAQGFKDLLAFCLDAPRTRGEIDELLAPVCAAERSARKAAAQALYPSYFTDRLERCGALVWKDGWRTTDEGAAFVRGLSAGE